MLTLSFLSYIIPLIWFHSEIALLFLVLGIVIFHRHSLYSFLFGSKWPMNFINISISHDFFLPIYHIPKFSTASKDQGSIPKYRRSFQLWWSYYKDKTVVRQPYLHNGNTIPVRLSLYWDGCLFPVEYQVYISLALLQLCCGGTCEIWIWFKQSDENFFRGKIFLTEKMISGTLETHYPRNVNVTLGSVTTVPNHQWLTEFAMLPYSVSRTCTCIIPSQVIWHTNSTRLTRVRWITRIVWR